MQEARSEIRATAELYRGKYPEVARTLEENIEETFAVAALPETHQKRLTTTNTVEWVNQTIKQRTRLVRIFPNRESCIRLVTALLVDLHEDWITGHRYLNMQKEESGEELANPAFLHEMEPAAIAT